MSHVFGRHSQVNPPIAVAGSGCYLTDSTGKQYFDGSGGAAVSCLGHGDLDVMAAMKAQIDQLSFAHTGFFTSSPAEALADLLIAHAPSGIDRVYFVSGGSEAIEACLKLARQYFIEKSAPQRTRIIARKQSYHGNTLGALAAGGNLARRQQFAPLLFDVSHIDPCYAYRGKAADETIYAYGQRMADALEAEILRLGAETVMAFLAEPIVGATLGAVAAEAGYFTRIRQICDQYGVLLILDEVMCGMGRTGALFACQHDAVRPDIIAIAKGLGAGYQPIGAMLCSADIYQQIAEGSGFFQHGHTYLGHPVACAAGLAVLQKIITQSLPERAAIMGQQLKDEIINRFGQHPHIGDIRGRGLFIGMEFVRDRTSKAPFDPNLQIHKKIKAAAFDAGLLCYPMGGTVDGKNGDHLLLAPPFIIETVQFDEIIDKLEHSINQVFTAL